MDSVLWIVGTIGLFAVCFAGLASLLVGLPGTFVIALAGLVYAWATGFTTVTGTTAGWLFGLAIAGEIIDLVVTSAAAGAAGTQPSRRVNIAAIVGALVGGIVGTPFFFGVGSLIGAMLGAFAGAALAARSDGGDVNHSLRVGLAALSGKFFGFVIKAAIGSTMIVVIAGAIAR